MSYHVDRYGDSLRGARIVRHINGEYYEPIGTGLRIPGLSDALEVFHVDQYGNLINDGILGTSIKYVSSKEVEIIRPWRHAWKNIKDALRIWS